MKSIILLASMVWIRILAMIVAQTGDKSNRTHFTGREKLTDLFSHMGIWEHVDGKIYITGWKIQADDITNDPRTTGKMTVVQHSIWSDDAYNLGPAWGTGQLVNDKGCWDIVWHGQRTLDTDGKVHSS